MTEFIRTPNGSIPNYVIDDDANGVARVRNQFTGNFELIGPRPFSNKDAKVAGDKLIRREIEWLRADSLKREAERQQRREARRGIQADT